MDRDKFKSYLPIASFGACIAVAIGFFQFLAVANVLFSIASAFLYMWISPIAPESKRLRESDEGVFLSGFLSLSVAAVFVTTTPAIIIAWAFRLRDGYEIEILAMEAFLLSLLLFLTTVCGIQGAYAKRDMNKIAFGDEPKSGENS